MSDAVEQLDKAGSQQVDGDTESAEAKVDKAIVVVRRELQKRGWWPWQQLWPVRRKVFMMIYERLLLIQAALHRPEGAKGGRNECCDKRIIETVNLLLDGSIDENAAWDVADSLKELLPELGQREYVYWALVEEKGREPEWKDNWSKYFPVKDLDNSIKEYEKEVKESGTPDPAERLAALYRIRDGLGRHGRAREGIRWRYLVGVSVVLGLLAVALLLVWFFVVPSNLQTLPHMILAAVSGAVGAVLSGALRLRDLGRIVELQAVSKTLLLQTVLGATLAIIVALILQTDIVQIGSLELKTAPPAEWFVVGFVSGFSEPFALGILKRIASLGDEGKTP